MKKITEEEIQLEQTVNGGWAKETLTKWGVPWPPPKGWKAALIRNGVPYRTSTD